MSGSRGSCEFGVPIVETVLPEGLMVFIVGTQFVRPHDYSYGSAYGDRYPPIV